MDIEFDLYGIRFVANGKKSFKNPQKHEDVTFEVAAQVFFDPFLRVVDASHSTESREAIIGMDEASRLLFVVHVELEQDRIRIISARKATRDERRFYEDY